jgi:carboxyl-terminal processing protease
MTPEELKAKGIDDFQLWYAVRTLGHTNPAMIAMRKR